LRARLLAGLTALTLAGPAVAQSTTPSSNSDGFVPADQETPREKSVLACMRDQAAKLNGATIQQIGVKDFSDIHSAFDLKAEAMRDRSPYMSLSGSGMCVDVFALRNAINQYISKRT